MSRYKSRIAAILTSMFIVLCSFVVAAPSAFAEDSQLANANYSTGDLYASLIFSKSSDVESADGVELSFNQIGRYPADGTLDETQTYGRLLEPDPNSRVGFGRAAVGGRLVSQIRTYYDYGWFEPLPKAEDNIVSRIFQVVIGWSEQTVSSNFTRGALSGAMIGATMFDFSTSMVSFGEKIALGVNIPELLGLVERNGSSSIVGDIVGYLFTKIGVNKSAIGTLRTIVLVCVFGAFVLILLNSLRRSKFAKDEHARNFRRLGSRIIVMVLTLPMAIIFTQIINLVTSPISALDEYAGEVNSDYIVDTLDWAVYGNLSLKMVNPTGTLNNDGSVSTDFAPTRENVKNLRKSLDALKAGNNNINKESSSAMALLEDFASGKTASAQDYFAGLSALNTQVWNYVDTSTGPGARDSHNLNDFSTGYRGDNSKYNKQGGPVYFFSPQKKKSDDSSVDSSMIQKGEIKLGKVTFKLSDNSPVTARRVAVNNPQSYLYGAVPPENLNEATKKFSNYIYDYRDSQQLINPETGEKISDVAGDKENAIRTNALRIAIINRYSGLRPMTFSDQSTAFFLQTKRTGKESINYKGYNTAANEAGESKNTGKYGNAFIRYVMPSVSNSDFLGRVGSLTAVWAMSGILGFASLFILLRAPVFGALFRSLKGFLSAILTGNIIGFLEYLLFYGALRLSFLFATAGMYFGIAINKYMLADNSLIYSNLGLVAGGTGVTGLVPVIGTGISTGLSLVAILPIVSLSMLLCLVICVPVIKVQYNNKKIKRVSIMGALIMLPFLVAEAIHENLDGLHQAMYGKPRKVAGEGLMAGRIGHRFTRKARAEQNRANIEQRREKLADKTDSRKSHFKAEKNRAKAALHRDKVADKMDKRKSHIKAEKKRASIDGTRSKLSDEQDKKRAHLKAEQNKARAESKRAAIQDKADAKAATRKAQEKADKDKFKDANRRLKEQNKDTGDMKKGGSMEKSASVTRKAQKQDQKRKLVSDKKKGAQENKRQRGVAPSTESLDKSAQELNKAAKSMQDKQSRRKQSSAQQKKDSQAPQPETPKSGSSSAPRTESRSQSTGSRNLHTRQSVKLDKSSVDEIKSATSQQPKAGKNNTTHVVNETRTARETSSRSSIGDIRPPRRSSHKDGGIDDKLERH